MKTLACAVLFCVLATIMAKDPSASPKVQVYSRKPGIYGFSNVLICHVSGFHPPQINISILKNGKEIPDANQTDLAFEPTWQFHLTKSVAFTPQSGEDYTCVVSHLGRSKTYTWESDM